MAKEANAEINKGGQADRVAVFLPVIPGEPDEVFVALNGKGYTIQRGTSVMVPVAIKDILDESQARKQMQLMRIRQLEADAKKPRVAGM